jgi:hypothetical protein
MTKNCRFCAEEIQAAAIICRFCNREQRIEERPSSSPSWLPAAIAAAIVVVLGGATLVSYYTWTVTQHAGEAGKQSFQELIPPPEPPPPPPPLQMAIADEAFRRMPATSYFSYSFQLNDNRPCRLRGRIQVTAGGSHDVDVLVVDDDGMLNFQNGNGANTYLNEHRRSAVTLDLPVDGYKQYHLVISNNFSLFTSKTVSLENVRGVCGDVDGDGVGDV